MGRIRTIKPGFFRSRSLAQCSLAARITFAGLWTEADDLGRGDATPRLIATALWPWDNPTDDDVQSWLDELADTGHIVLYEHRGGWLYQVLRWTEHQAAAYRRGESTLPAPPDDTPPHTSARNRTAKSAGTEQTGVEGKGADGNGPGCDKLAPEAVVSSAVDIYAEWVYATDPSKCKTIPERYKFGIKRNTMDAHGAALRAHLKKRPTATDADLAAEVLGVPGIGNTTASKVTAPAWYADPSCECRGDGITNLAPEGMPAMYDACPCRRAEPYPEATVLAFKPREESA